MIETTHLSDTKRALLEKYLQGKAAQISDTLFGIPRRSCSDVVPLSLYQEDVWERVQTAGEAPPFFNESITIHRHGPLDVAILNRTLCEIYRRHEAWRTKIDISQGRPLQVIGTAPQKVSLPIVDLREFPIEMREAAALRAGEEQARTPFNLKEGPLVRATLVRLRDEYYRLFFTMHQLVVDGISVYNILPSELASIYEAFSQGNPSPLSDLPVQPGDFAIWQRQWILGKVAENQLAYWRKQLSGGIALLRWGNGVTPQTSPSYLASYLGAIQSVTFTEGLTKGVRELSQREGITVFMVLLAAFNVLLWHYTGQNHITVGTLAPAGRKRAEVQKLLGYFINPVALPIDLSGVLTFRELLCEVRQVTLGALTNDDIPLEWVLRELKSGWDPFSSGGLRVIISLAPTMQQIQRGWDMTPMDVNSGGSRWELYLELADRPGGLIGRAQYNPEIFTERTVRQMLADLQLTLERAILNPRLRVSELGPFSSYSRGRHVA